MKREQVDVLVIGAGPAGLTAAITLARQDVDVLVVDRHPGTSPFPKATSVSTRSMELLRTWGLEGQVRAGGMRMQPRIAIAHTLVSPVLGVVSFGYPTDEQAHAVSPASPCYCPQDHLEPVLARYLLERGGRLRFHTELRGLRTGPTGVTADLFEHGRPSRIEARYLIGADGPRSTVRGALGIGVTEHGTLGNFLAVTFRADLAARLPHVPSGINVVEVSGAAGILVPTSNDGRWIYARQLDQDAPVDRDPRACVERLRVATGLPDLRPKILSVMEFEMGAHTADVLRSGHAFLVGDAAHRTTPEGGIGMNTAIHGAHNLGWKLGWVLRGLAGESLLDSYDTERGPVGLANALQSLQLDAEVDGLTADVGVRYGDTARAPHAWIRQAGRRISTIDLFDDRLTLLTGPDGTHWRRAAAALGGRGLPVTALTLGRDFEDEEGGFEREYGLGSAGAVLVRPDGYLPWRHHGLTSDAAQRLAAAVDSVLGRTADGARAGDDTAVLPNELAWAV